MITQRLEDTTETSGKLREVSAASAVCWYSQIQLSQRQVNVNPLAIASGTAATAWPRSASQELREG